MLTTKQLLYLYDKVNKRNILGEYAGLFKTSQCDLPHINEYQQRHLKSIIDYAARYVPYFRNIGKEYRLNNDESAVEFLARLPILTKDIIRSDFGNFLSEEFKNSKKLSFYYTGGSTGQPSKIAVDKEYLDFRWAMVHYNLSWVGYTLGDCYGFIYGSNLDAKEDCSFRQKLQQWMMNYFQVNAFCLNEDNMEKFAQKCLKRRPKFLVGYASGLAAFAKYAERKGIPIHPRFVESTAEYLSPEVRQEIERVFACKVYDRYGSREVGNVAHECVERNGFHIDWQSVYVEIINKGKYPFLDNDYGDIVITSLKIKGMPLIRYVTGDIGKIDYSPCRCGMASPRLFLGGARVLDILYTTGGDMISPSPLSLTTRELYSIKKIQYVQESPRFLKVNVVTDHEDDSNISATLGARLKKIFGEGMEIEFHFVDEIEREQSGKYRLTKRLF